MTDPLSITASVAGIATAAIQSIQFLYTTIGDIKDVPSALKDIKSDLQTVEPILQKLRTALGSNDSQVLLIDDIKQAVENCNSSCAKFQSTLAHWMRHSTEDKTFWADRWRVGIFEQGKIQVFKGQLSNYKDTLVVALQTSSVLTLDRHGFIMEDLKKTMLKSNEELVEQGLARAESERAVIESSLQQLSNSLATELSKESQRNLQQLLKETREQSASNEAFRKTCEEALSMMKTSTIHDGIKQDIKNTKADENSRAVAGLVNTSGEVRNIEQSISDTVAGKGSFAAAGIIQNFDSGTK